MEDISNEDIARLEMEMNGQEEEKEEKVDR
jgi:hypothetical protein